MNFLRSKAFAWTVATLVVAAFVLPGAGETGLAIGVAAAVGIWMWIRYQNRPDRALYRKLLRMARGDRSLVERLIEHERMRDPQASRVQHIRNAIRSWERDLN